MWWISWSRRKQIRLFLYFKNLILFILGKGSTGLTHYSLCIKCPLQRIDIFWVNYYSNQQSYRWLFKSLNGRVTKQIIFSLLLKLLFLFILTFSWNIRIIFVQYRVALGCVKSGQTVETRFQTFPTNGWSVEFRMKMFISRPTSNGG